MRLQAAELDRRLADLSRDRGHELAKLLASSGWTSRELGERMGRSHMWVVRQMRYGRFLVLETNVSTRLSALETNVSTDLEINGSKLSEGAFHALWSRTCKSDDEGTRFAEVIRLAKETDQEIRPSSALADKIMARAANGKWHALDAIAEKEGVSQAVLDATLKSLERAPYRAKIELKTVGIRPHCRIFHADKMIRLSELKEKFGPIIDELKQQGKTNAATVSITAVKHCAHQLQKIIDDWSALGE